MISSIKVSKIASYDEKGIEINSLNKFNFFYGNNGCGKSTLSKILNSPEDFQDSKVVFDNLEYKTLVYNKEFINKHFSENHEIPGIFTLGKEAVTTQEQIKVREDQINHLNGILPTKEVQLKTKEQGLAKLEESFKERAWELKKKYDYDFSNVLTGTRGSKIVFTQTLISKIEAVEEDNVVDLDSLKDRTLTLFKENHEPKIPLSL